MQKRRVVSVQNNTGTHIGKCEAIHIQRRGYQTKSTIYARPQTYCPQKRPCKIPTAISICFL